MNKQAIFCPCGSDKKYTDCCGCYLDGGESAPTAETLMRSRYTAYTHGREDYLLATWHHSTRPASLELASEPRSKWLDLEVVRHKQTDPDHAVVEFVAHYKVGTCPVRAAVSSASSGSGQVSDNP